MIPAFFHPQGWFYLSATNPWPKYRSPNKKSNYMRPTYIPVYLKLCFIEVLIFFKTYSLDMNLASFLFRLLDKVNLLLNKSIRCNFLYFGWGKQFELVNQFTCFMALQLAGFGQCLGRFLGIIGQDPSVPKSNRLHVAITRLSFINLRCVP